MAEHTHEMAPHQVVRTTRIYGKMFALVTMFAGLGLTLGTPAIVNEFKGGPNSWVDALPDWTLPTMMIIGMIGGILIALASTVFGLLIPSRVIREIEPNGE